MHTGSAQAQTWQNLGADQESVCNGYLLGWRRSFFFNGVSLGLSTYFGSSYLSNTTWTPWFFLVCVCVWYVFVCLFFRFDIFVLLFVFIFTLCCLFFLKRGERAQIWTAGEVRRIWEELEEGKEYGQDIGHEKI